MIFCSYYEKNQAFGFYSYNKILTASLSLNEEKNFKEIDGKDGDTVANCFNFNIRSAKDLKSYLDLAESVDFLAGELEIDINGEISSPYTIYKLKNKKIVPVL